MLYKLFGQKVLRFWKSLLVFETSMAMAKHSNWRLTLPLYNLNVPPPSNWWLASHIILESDFRNHVIHAHENSFVKIDLNIEVDGKRLKGGSKKRFKSNLWQSKMLQRVKAS